MLMFRKGFLHSPYALLAVSAMARTNRPSSLSMVSASQLLINKTVYSSHDNSLWWVDHVTNWLAPIHYCNMSKAASQTILLRSWVNADVKCCYRTFKHTWLLVLIVSRLISSSLQRMSQLRP